MAFSDRLTIAELKHMSMATRLEAMDQLWTTIAAEGGPPITAGERAYAQKLQDEFEQDPAGSRPWTEVRRELEQQLSDS